MARRHKGLNAVPPNRPGTVHLRRPRRARLARITPKAQRAQRRAAKKVKTQSMKGGLGVSVLRVFLKDNPTPGGSLASILRLGLRKLTTEDSGLEF